MAYSCVSFTTDYGLADGFVAACHGVAAGLAPHVRLIDVTHLVPPGDIRRGALVLAQTAPYLPRHTVHVAVVDPGVGTLRRAVALETDSAALVGPDNGLLAAAAHALGGARRAVELTNDAWFRRPVSPTFHGRDIFSAVAGHLCRGVDLSELGPSVAPADLASLPAPVLRRGERWLEAEVLGVDRFGNVQLPAGEDMLAGVGADIDARVALNGQPATRDRTFGSVPPGELVLYVDSAGLVAVAVNGGSAAERLGVGVGDTIRLTVQA